MNSVQITRVLPRSDALTHLSRNTILFFILNIATAAFSFLISVIVARGLGAAALGQYSLALAWSLTLAQFADFGMNTLLTRELAREPSATPRCLAAALYAKTLFALLLLCGLLVFASQVTREMETALTLQLGAALILLNSWYSTFVTVLRAFGRAAAILIFNVAGLLLQTTVTLWLVLAGWQVPLILVSAVVLQAVQCAALIFWYRARFHFDAPREPFDRKFVWQLLRRAAPFALAGILGAVELRANIFLLGWLNDERAVGWYSAASRVTDGLRLAPNAFFGALLPALATLSTREHADAARCLFRRAQYALLAFALLIAFGVTVSASWLVQWTYGAQFDAARGVLIILAWGLVPALWLGLLTLFLYAQHQERAVNRVLALGLVLHVAFAIPLILNFNAPGAAVGAMLSDLVVCALLHAHALPFLKNE